MARRGLDKAETVVAVTDGAEWLQSFIDYHCPKAIDFAHAAEAGRAVWGEDTEAFASWFARSRHQLKHQPPQMTLAELRLLQPKAKQDEQAAALDSARLYLQRRLEMIDYPYFQRRGYIGSGSVESAHKQIVQRRFKQASMRWAPQNVDPLLALRDLTCNQRWSEGWDHIVDYHWQQRHQIVRQRKQEGRSKPSASVTFSMLKDSGLLTPAAELDEIAPVKEKPKKKPEDHPWRKNKWPTKESWRWNK